MATYESFRRQARTLESVLDSKMATYSRLGTSLGAHDMSDLESGSNDRWSDLEAEIEGLFEKLTETVEEMAALLNNPSSPPTQSMLHTVQRHRDVLQDYKTDYRRTKTNLQHAFDRANLLNNVRSDIESYKTAHSSTTDALLAERNRIDSSHRMTDDILAQAYETRAEFGRQRASIAGINARMGNVISSMPGIDSLLGMIRTRRRRDAVIMGVVFGIGLVVILRYHWG
ncbi:related to SNARE protein of Golgi compartment [Serendipita indica DSM 11827]|uniref:Golgi SNAP receptor complex member 1 n=1 Tax=Serendipita indica (strain DSM 11827) TaxID=1109443 RepID=G4T8X9_SERID|nr:related to SNARE protein of Golgi compartment [Serendipita indica DSM 11827]